MSGDTLWVEVKADYKASNGSTGRLYLQFEVKEEIGEGEVELNQFLKLFEPDIGTVRWTNKALRIVDEPSDFTSDEYN